MKNIKIRFWDTQKKRMSLPISIGQSAVLFDDGGMSALDVGRDADRFIPMLATGEKDSEGIEIFDGDLMLFVNTQKGAKQPKRPYNYVYWDTVKLRWLMGICPPIDQFNSKCPLYARLASPSQYTVVGNIYANEKDFKKLMKGA